jgi:uncharacterized membrane protein
MRRLIRGLGMRRGVGAALAIALALAACQRNGAEAPEPSAPSNAEREAEIAAEQLAALGGPANANQRSLYEGDFQASGGLDSLGASEGAWELTLLADYAQFSRPGLGEDGGVAGERDYHEHGMRVVAGPLTITLMQQACTASDVELPYTAHVLFEGVAYQGCARRGVDEGPRSNWASVLPELVPAIDACLGRATSQPARVTFATAIDDADVSVRVREADGSRRECVANAGGDVRLYEPLSDIDRRAGESDPEFQRGGQQPRPCAEAAVDRRGARLGWLIARGC